MLSFVRATPNIHITGVDVLSKISQRVRTEQEQVDFTCTFASFVLSSIVRSLVRSDGRHAASGSPDQLSAAHFPLLFLFSPARPAISTPARPAPSVPSSTPPPPGAWLASPPRTQNRTEPAAAVEWSWRRLARRRRSFACTPCRLSIRRPFLYHGGFLNG